MLSFEFEKELSDALENALQGSGIKPSWVLHYIEPVIERNCQSAQQSVRRTGLTCPECDSRIMDNGYCMMGHWCGKPLR